MRRKRSAYFPSVALFVVVLIFVGASPVLAASSTSPDSFQLIINRITNWLEPKLLAVALLVFVIGAGRYMLGGHDPQHETFAKRMMISAVISMVLILTASLITSQIQSFFG